MAFQNLYYKRTAATAKACYVCYKPTVIVLATINTADFFYTCPVHLADRGFATRAADPEPEPKKIGVSAEEIAELKQEWEAKQRQKSEKGKEKEQQKEREKDGGKDDKDNGKDTDGAQRDKDEKESARDNLKNVEVKKHQSSVDQPSPSPRPTHERYVLHRDIFALRVADHRRRRQAAQAKDLAPRLPGAPSGALS